MMIIPATGWAAVYLDDEDGGELAVPVVCFQERRLDRDHAHVHAMVWNRRDRTLLVEADVFDHEPRDLSDPRGVRWFLSHYTLHGLETER
jgi:hypothetical protein